MGFTITMEKNPAFTGVHMGLVFADGEAHTDDAFLATRLKNKGYTVAAEDISEDKAAHEQVEDSEADSEAPPDEPPAEKSKSKGKRSGDV